MRISNLTDATLDVVRTTSSYISELTTPTVRIGITGLSRSGKTVFVTSLVKTLLDQCGRPNLPTDLIHGFRAFLEPQPDDDLPRFPYEKNLQVLTSDSPTWPESTRRISQLRITLEWDAQDWARRNAGISRRLHIDLIDYPGEWLVDLGILPLSYTQWCATLELLPDVKHRDNATELWRAYQNQQREDAAPDEHVAMKGAELYRNYLNSQRKNDPAIRLITPGRFLLPGDLEGSPLLTFFPLRMADNATIPQNSLAALLERRYESYKNQVVLPFFERHFQSLDRQIVLIDALGAMNEGARAIGELENTIDRILEVFRPGRNAWWRRIFDRRIERVMFAATKADHIHSSNHHRLKQILHAMVLRSARRIEAAGADIKVAALAALRSTQDMDYGAGDNRLPCILGRPVKGESIGRQIFDGTTDTVLFPGDLPEDPYDIFETDKVPVGQLQFVRFLPPNVKDESAIEELWPHVGLQEVVQFLLGDHIK
ncbi:MAG: YcjX family protein [Hyphomicrobiaceae bacterium]